MTEKVIVSNKGLVKTDFNFWVGRYMDKFYDGLEQKKIIGNKCSKCGKVFCPPRQVCGECKEIIPLDQNWVNLPDTGILVNYTMTPYKVSDRRERKVKELQIIGMVKIDGSNTAIVNRVLNLTAAEVKTGMKVKVSWNEKTTGVPEDINGFVKV